MILIIVFPRAPQHYLLIASFFHRHLLAQGHQLEIEMSQIQLRATKSLRTIRGEDEARPFFRRMHLG
jgi:hypothetical protein